MPTYSERLETAVALAEADADKLHDIVNNAYNGSDVSTDGGTVKPIAKVIYEGQQALAAAVSALETSATASAAAAAAAQTAAETAQAAAEAARDTASGHATNAGTSAAAAADSESDASGHAASALSSKTAAETAQAASEVAQAAAETAETNAASSASAASTSATSASGSATSAAASAATALTVASGLNYKGFIAGASVAGLSPLAGDCYVVTPAGGGYSDLDLIIRNPSGWDAKARSVWLDPYAPSFAARAARKGIVSTGTAFVAQRPPLDLNTLDFTLGWSGYISDTTPTSSLYFLAQSNNSTLGFEFYLTTSGFLRVIFRATGVAYTSTAALPSTAGWFDLVAAMDRSGNLIFGANGVQLGDPIDISADVASSFTTTDANPLYFGSFRGAFFAATTFGECFVSLDVLTPAQFAQIHANGTAQGLGINMLAHWVPSQSLCVGIFQDISGNNNHAVLGASGIELIGIDALPSAAQAQSLVFSGTTGGNRIYSTLNGQGPTDGDFTTFVGHGYFSNADSFTKLIAGYSPSYSDPSTTNGLFEWAYNTGSGYLLRYLNSTGANYRILSSVPLFAQRQAKSALGDTNFFAISRQSGAMKIRLCTSTGIYDVTSLFTESTSGATPPAWSDAIASTYAIAMYRQTNYVAAGQLSAFDTFNCALTDADLEYRMRNGRWHPKFGYGDNDELYTATNAASAANDDNSTTGVSDWRTGTITSVADPRTGSSGSYSIAYDWPNANNSTHLVFDDFPVVKGRAYYLDLWVKGTPAGGSLYGPIVVGVGNAGTAAKSANWSHLSGTLSVTADGGWQRLTGVMQAQIDGFLVVGCYSSGTDELRMFTGDRIQVDDLSGYAAGVTAALDTQDGAAWQPKNPRFENGSSHWTMSTTGVDWAVKKLEGGRVAVTKTFTHDQISSTANTTLQGYMPGKWGMAAIFLTGANSFDAGTTLNFGYAGNATEFASAVALDGTSIRYLLPSRRHPLSNGGAWEIYLQKNQATTQGSITVTLILERAF